jgi:hypothetical protein
MANGGSRSFNGASLAQRLRRMSPPQRAILAANIIDGRVIVQGLTAKAITAICGASGAYVSAALRLTPEQRAAVSNGTRPLVTAPPRPAFVPTDWAKADTNKIVDVIREIGIDRALNAAIEVEAEHATT